MEASRRETAPTPSGLILTTRYGSQSGELMPSCALVRQTFPSNRANSNVRQRNGNRRPSIGRDARIFKLDLEQGRKLSALDLMSALKKVNAVSRSFAAFFETMIFG